MISLPPLWFVVPGAFLSILTVAGNGIVVYLIVTRKRLHNPTNWVVFSLGVADLFLGAGYVLIICLPPVYNAVKYNMKAFLCTASALNLCLLTLDRYIFITKPLRYVTLMTTRRVLLLIFIAWVASFLPHFILKACVLASPDKFCIYDDGWIRFAIFDFVLFEVLPMVILASAAGHTFCIVRQQSHRMERQMAQLGFNQGTDEPKEKISAQNKRTSSMKLICVAVTVFIVCYSVEIILSVYRQMVNKNAEPWDPWFILDLLYIVNSAINPVAYALFKSDIKKSLKRMFRCTKSQFNRHNQQEGH